MRLSIRYQILLPLIAIQAISVCAVTAASAALAAGRSERQIIDRLNGVIQTLGHANFPHTAGVLSLMRGLSGAEFVAYDADGRAVAASFAEGVGSPPPLDAAPKSARLDSLGQSPVVSLGGVSYFAVAVEGSANARGTSLLVLYPETSWRQARREAAVPALLLGLGSLATMAGVTSWIAHRIGVRIQRLNPEVARIASGRFDALEPGLRRDEIADLVDSINAMCDQLRAMRRTIHQWERTRLLAQLAAGLAHQMRNSLTGARMSIQLHARRFPTPGRDQGLNVALRQLAMTEEQVKGLLSLGRVETPARSVCDLRKVVDDVIVLVDPACEHARVTLTCHVPDEPLDVFADESGLRAAVLNLVLNAVEAAGPGGAVRIEAAGDETAIVEVYDTGPGPPPALADALFEPFATSKPEGVGLGLALAHGVATGHGGRLTWDRVAAETRFRLTLPRHRAAVKDAV